MPRKKPRRWVMLSMSTLLAGMICLLLLVHFSNDYLKITLISHEKPKQILAYEQLQRERFPADLESNDARPKETIAYWGEDITALEERFEEFDRLMIQIQRYSEGKFWDDFYRWDSKPYVEWTEEDWALFVEFFNTHETILKSIQELVAKGGPVYPLDFEKGLSLELPHLSKVRNMTRWLGYGAAAQAYQGNYDQALDYLHAAFECGALVEDEPILISFLVEKACNSIAFGMLDSIFPPEALTSSQASHLIALAQERSTRPWGVESLLGEIYLSQSVFTTPQALSPEELVDIFQGGSFNNHSPISNTLAFVYRSPLSSPLRQLNYASHVEHMNSLYALSQQPFYVVQEEADVLQTRIDTLPFYRGIAQILAISPRALEAQTRDYARYDLMWMGLTLEQYHAQHGAYPTTLSVAIPDAPVDPYSGTPYRYEVTGDTFLLYSIGNNLQDDGGQHDLRHLDIVWRGSNSPE